MDLFLERTICCKVKTGIDTPLSRLTFLERTICCKVKTYANWQNDDTKIFRKNNLL